MSTPFAFKFRWYVTLACSLHLALLPRPARCHLGSISDAEDVPLVVGGLLLGPEPDLQLRTHGFVNNAHAPTTCCAVGAPRSTGLLTNPSTAAHTRRIVYKSVGAQIEDGRDQG